MKKTIIFILFVFLGLGIFSQDIKKVLQQSVDFEILFDHLKKNPIINFGYNDFIFDNGIFPRNIDLIFDGDTLKINNFYENEESFMNGFTFEFLKIKVKKKKALVIYNYCPYWNRCVKTTWVSQGGEIHYRVELIFIKDDNWEIKDFKIKDIDIEKLSECRRERYIKIE